MTNRSVEAPIKCDAELRYMPKRGLPGRMPRLPTQTLPTTPPPSGVSALGRRASTTCCLRSLPPPTGRRATLFRTGRRAYSTCCDPTNLASRLQHTPTRGTQRQPTGTNPHAEALHRFAPTRCLTPQPIRPTQPRPIEVENVRQKGCEIAKTIGKPSNI